jgi:hypothetical protein
MPLRQRWLTGWGNSPFRPHEAPPLQGQGNGILITVSTQTSSRFPRPSSNSGQTARIAGRRGSIRVHSHAPRLPGQRDTHPIGHPTGARLRCGGPIGRARRHFSAEIPCYRGFSLLIDFFERRLWARFGGKVLEFRCFRPIPGRINREFLCPEQGIQFRRTGNTISRNREYDFTEQGIRFRGTGNSKRSLRYERCDYAHRLHQQRENRRKLQRQTDWESVDAGVTVLFAASLDWAARSVAAIALPSGEDLHGLECF